MMPETFLADCQDPLIALVIKQAKAIELLHRGLRPKQVLIMTGLSIKRVRDLYGGLVPADQRVARTPRGPSTIMRQSKPRIAASMLVAAYRRIIGDGNSLQADKYEHFVEAYDFYCLLATGVQNVIPILSIEDAFTIIHALHRHQILLAKCTTHDLDYVLIPDNDRGQSCPNCNFEIYELNQPRIASEAMLDGAVPK